MRCQSELLQKNRGDLVASRRSSFIFNHQYVMQNVWVGHPDALTPVPTSIQQRDQHHNEQAGCDRKSKRSFVGDTAGHIPYIQPMIPNCKHTYMVLRPQLPNAKL